MPFAIIVFDSRHGAECRLADSAARIDHFTDHCDPMLSSSDPYDDWNQPFGGIIVLETEAREVAEQFVKNDLSFSEDINSEYRILRWGKGFLNKQRYI